jgi:hypothetical protein
MLAYFKNEVRCIPVGREVRVQAENSVFRAADIVDHGTKVLEDCKRNIDKQADVELNQPGITEADIAQISVIKQEAANLLAKGNDLYIEAMQAVTDWLS